MYGAVASLWPVSWFFPNKVCVWDSVGFGLESKPLGDTSMDHITSLRLSISFVPGNICLLTSLSLFISHPSGDIESAFAYKEAYCS